VLQDRRNVRRDKEFAVAKTDDDRRTLANGDDRVRLVHRDDRERKDPAKLLDRFPRRFLEREILLVLVMTDQVSDDLGVGFGFEVAAVRLQAALSASDNSR
jgi:hypothetical protein